TRSPQPLPPIPYVVLEDVLAEIVEARVVSPPLIGRGKLADEILEIRITGDHERRDRDPLAAADHGFIQYLVDDPAIEAEGVTVHPPVFEMATRLAVGDHKDLLVGIFPAMQDVAGA